LDDYGHHPTEIRATLGAVRESWPDRRLVVLFQPHRYSRTQALFDEFSRAFYHSDVLVMLPVYSAGEKEIPGVDSEGLCRAISAHGHKEAVYAADKPAAVACLGEILRPNDLLLTLGAGDVWQVGMSILALFGSGMPNASPSGVLDEDANDA
jgi:UDP-N-acetylmuramate--alanine ligase